MRANARGRILVVDDDATVAEILSRYLTRDGYEVDSVGSGSLALERAKSHPPDLILLDLMLPDISGLDVCRRVRRITPAPIIMLTARGEEDERIFGLKIGADDYVVKPFSPREVAARVGSVLRRTEHRNGSKSTASRVVAGSIEIDLHARSVSVAGEPVTLTAREFDLLSFLAQNPDRVFRRADLLEHVWGYTVGDTATVTVHIRRLRGKIEADPSQPVHIETVWGIGYRFRK
jgi:DNA-binding response OmpR family regulator